MVLYMYTKAFAKEYMICYSLKEGTALKILPFVYFQFVDFHILLSK